MNIIDPGHVYELAWLDGTPRLHDGTFGCGQVQNQLIFVKREDDKYPGNVGHHPGTTMQEVLRVLIDRLKYVDNQLPHHANETAAQCLRMAILALEGRAAEQHSRLGDFIKRFSEAECIELVPTCPKCGHIGCEGACHP